MRRWKNNLIAMMLLCTMLLSGCFGIVDAHIEYELQNVDLSCSDWRTFSASIDGYSIDYPSHWDADLLSGYHGDWEAIALFVAPNNMVPGVLIASKQMENPTLQDIADWGEMRIREKREPYEIEWISLEETNIDGRAILIREYRVGAGEPLTARKEAYIVNDDDAFIIRLTATSYQYEEVEPCFDQMVNSICFFE